MEITKEELQNFIDIAEKLMPGFTNKVKRRMDENAMLLQTERNISDDISDIKNIKIPEITKRMKVLDDEIKACKVSLNSKINEYANCKKSLVEYELHAKGLESKLTAIHMKWIKLNPAKSTAKESAPKFNMRQAFDVFTDICGWMPGDYYSKSNLDKLYKRFDNLLHKRCSTTFMFGYNWSADDVHSMFCRNGHDTIANSIKLMLTH